jgi:exodeoxyribonuclease VII small subunit
MKPVEELTFEEAFAELEETLRKLEAGGMTLEQGLALYERGQALAAACNTRLDQAEVRIRQLTPEGEVIQLEAEE